MITATPPRRAVSTWAKLTLVGWLLAGSLLVGPQARAQVRIGVGAPLSGSDAVFGTQIRIGVEQALSDINASGGILGQRAALSLGDDLGDPKGGAVVAATFVRDKVPFVIGHFSSGVTLPASLIYSQAGVLEITPSATAPQVTERDLPTIFRLCGRDDRQALVAARYLLDHHVARVAILHDRTAPAKALADAVRKALAADGQKEVLYASLDKGDRDFAPLVQRLRASGSQVAFWGGTQTEAGLLAKQLRDAGLRTTLIGGVGLASDEFASLAGPSAEGTLMTFPIDPRQRPEAADLLRRLRANGGEPDAYAFYAYAAVQVIRQAAEAAGSLQPADLARTMRGGAVFQTVVGRVSFDEHGDLAAPDYAVHVWHRNAVGRMTFHDLADF